MAISQRIKTIRVKLELKQSYMAYKMGVTQQFYSSIENGERGFTFNTIARVAKVLEVDPLFIITTGIPITDETIRLFKNITVSEIVIDYFDNNNHLSNVIV